VRLRFASCHRQTLVAVRVVLALDRKHGIAIAVIALIVCVDINGEAGILVNSSRKSFRLASTGRFLGKERRREVFGSGVRAQDSVGRS
jgi:hypothetical protein